jgi:cellulose synthase/poly-beta-1,6-N-acetylglucosamine synthase-like glycosyltransferase
MIAVLLFWTSLAAIVYAYIGYPLVLTVLSPFLSKPVQKRSLTPSVTLIVSAYNEEKAIEEKIRNSLALDYPREMLDIMVVSDGSSDRTDEIVRAWSPSGVRLLRVEGRVGKTACLNRAVPEARGEIVVFSDANSVYDRNALKEMVANFADPGVGCVTGHTKYLGGNGTVDQSIGIYAQLEKLTKRRESAIGSCIGADGAIFAIRKELYRPLKGTDINDFVIPLNVVRQGYRTVFEEGAWCVEETAKEPEREFSRQVRITNRTLRAIFKKKLGFLSSPEHTLFSFELLSHKVAKFLVPLFLTSALVSNLALTGAQGFYRLLILLQAGFYALAVLERGFVSALLEKVMSACRTFAVVNAAILNGWITYARGRDFTTWKPHR